MKCVKEHSINTTTQDTPSTEDHGTGSNRSTSPHHKPGQYTLHMQEYSEIQVGSCYLRLAHLRIVECTLSWLIAHAHVTPPPLNPAPLSIYRRAPLR
mmetsp:Transcript_3605/g.5636  ORF Transcript_3605/g.5636 Transcript_3605/m.5636 type:complete len:97 (+) Transcript_3605:312-602(+)